MQNLLIHLIINNRIHFLNLIKQSHFYFLFKIINFDRKVLTHIHNQLLFYFLTSN